MLHYEVSNRSAEEHLEIRISRGHLRRSTARLPRKTFRRGVRVLPSKILQERTQCFQTQPHSRTSQEPSPRSTPSTRGSLTKRHLRKHLKTRRRTWNHDARQDLEEIPAHQTAEKQLTNLAQDKFQASKHSPIKEPTLSELQTRDSKNLRLKRSPSTVTGCQAQPGNPGSRLSSP